MSKNIFVVGADDFNCKLLEDIHSHRGYEFHSLLTFDEVKSGGRYPSFKKLIQQATRVLETFPGTIDAIVGYWDFPVNSMVPILCERYELESPSLESELKCDHKYWSRCEQQQVIAGHIPRFAVVDPFNDDDINHIPLDFPFWLKPIKSTDSFLAFRINNRSELRDSIQKIRNAIERIATPFNELLEYAELPDAIAAIHGGFCIAEEMISGHQCTVEGHVYQGEVVSHGVIDSYHYPGRSSFLSYEYPSLLPDSVKQAMIETSRTIISHIEFDNGAFNIEYFYDNATGNFKLLEINPRISQSHSEMFKFVDGSSNHAIMVELALGNKPAYTPGAGDYRCAAKFYLRRFEDGRLTRVPTPEELDHIMRDFPGTDIHLVVNKGSRLSELFEQDSYSYGLAHLYIGADDQRALLDKFHQIVSLLHFEFVGETGSEWKTAALQAQPDTL